MLKLQELLSEADIDAALDAPPRERAEFIAQNTQWAKRMAYQLAGRCHDHDHAHDAFIITTTLMILAKAIEIHSSRPVQ